MDAFVDVGQGFLDIFQQGLAAALAFLEAGLEGLFTLAGLQMAQFLADHCDQMIGVIQIEIIVSAFFEQVGGLVLLIAIVHHHNDRDILPGLGHHQTHFGEGRQIVGQPQQNQIQRLIIDRAAGFFGLVGMGQLQLIAIPAQGFANMINIGSGAIHDEQIDDGRIRHACQPLLMTGIRQETVRQVLPMLKDPKDSLSSGLFTPAIAGARCNQDSHAPVGFIRSGNHCFAAPDVKRAFPAIILGFHGSITLEGGFAWRRIALMNSRVDSKS